MSNPPPRSCRACATPVPGDAPFGHCPSCLVKLGFGEIPDDAKPSPRHPGRFGEYELLGQIGRGGMGVVYKARQVSLKRLVALKMLNPHASAFAGVAERLRAEAEVAGSLRHPQIVTIYDVDEHDGHPFFTMELIEGSGLDKFIGPDGFRPGLEDGTVDGPRRGPEAAAARIMIQIARAVDYAHRHGVLHRDLKPANILIDDQGQPHLTDFGLAKVLGRTAATGTASGAVLGTPAYMAPEQAAGGTKNVSVAADVYSLGAILYDMLTGRPPFRAETPLETLRRVVEDPPKPPSTFNRNIDADLAVICLKCLEKDPAHRYESALAMAEDLERWLRGEPIAGRSARRLERFWRWCRREPVLAGLLAGLISLVLVVAVLAVNLHLKKIDDYEKGKRLRNNQLNDFLGRLDREWDQDRVQISPTDLALIAEHELVIEGGERLVKLGFVSRLRKPDEAIQSIAPLVTYLQSSLATNLSPRPLFELLIFRSRTNAIQALVNNEVDILRLDPADYVRVRRQNTNVYPLVRQTHDGETERRGVIFTRADSPLNRLEDLAGKSLALGEADSALGDSLPKALLVAHGLRAASFSKLTHDRSTAVIGWVRRGTNDAGVAEMDDFENAIRLSRLESAEKLDLRLKALKEFRVPNPVWVATKQVDPALAARIAQQLRARREDDVPLPFDPKLTSFETATPADYDELARHLEAAERFQ